ncbi:fused tRNA nucleotidyl transferase; 2'3'-cyclic phosphodiesterase and 2'nucleotidase and phosphatase [Burkholderiales bacterium]|nr:fused tRNA nucleotidyl transferase; 2'3'-cyclic phosphodiesterase and 2'nucleotidase and phosphatase [Burkholderiales bacterium]
MKTYIVGGWVRDRLLEQAGRKPAHSADRDWVVVGSSPEEMLAKGFTAVGRDFPVFLHPQTGEEYALARTERKTAPGYRGFVVHADPAVSLEQDLQRRDLTINAMALDEHGQLIDPHHGQADLQQRVLRHVGPAFVEDPVRILRLARFAARLPDFSIAPQTMVLARGMVAAGEADALVPERVWQEITRGLMEDRPARMLEVLADTGLLARLAPELTVPAPLRAALDRVAQLGAPLAVRFALLASGASSAAGQRALLERWRADNDCSQLARLLFELRAELRVAPTPAELASVLERADALRRAERFAQLLTAFEALEGGSADRWRAAAVAASAVDAGAIAARVGPDPAAISQAVAAARRKAIAAATAGGGDPRA